MNPRVAIGFLVLVSCASLSTKAPEHALRVMSYNIEDGHEGLDSVAAVIRNEHPDIVGLQEVDFHWSARSNFDSTPTPTLLPGLLDATVNIDGRNIRRSTCISITC